MKTCPGTPNLVKIGQKYRAFYMKTWACLHSWGQHKILRNSTTAQGETILAFPWQHRTLFHCWQLHADEQYKGSVLLRFHVSNVYAKAAQCYMYNVFIELIASFLYYCSNCRQYNTSLRLSIMSHVSILPMDHHQGTYTVQDTSFNGRNVWYLRAHSNSKY